MTDGYLGIALIALLVCVLFLYATRHRRPGRPRESQKVASPGQRAEKALDPGAIEAIEAGEYTVVATVSGGLHRLYFYYIPSSAKKKPPLVIGLHGGAGNAIDFGQRSGMRAMAEKYGYAIVLPQGVSQKAEAGTWNVESTTARDYAEKKNIDDVGFITDILDEMKGIVAYDTSRVYVMGLSKGGMLAYFLACRIPDRIAAIAAVASTFSSEYCTVDNVALLHIHGTVDENIPWEGGAGKYSRIGANWPPVQSGIEAFAGIDTTNTALKSRRVTPDTTCWTHERPNGSNVEICIVEGGGHAWPGGQPSQWQVNSNTYVSPHFDATDFIGKFFLRH